MPLYIQGVHGGDATLGRAGADAAVPGLGDQRGRGGEGRGAPRVPPRGMIGSALVGLGLSAWSWAHSFPDWSRPCFFVGLAIVGTGMGPTSLSFILAVQHAVTWGQRGVATGAATFSRTIGGAIGVGLLGTASAGSSRGVSPVPAAAESISPRHCGPNRTGSSVSSSSPWFRPISA